MNVHKNLFPSFSSPPSRFHTPKMFTHWVIFHNELNKMKVVFALSVWSSDDILVLILFFVAFFFIQICSFLYSEEKVRLQNTSERYDRVTSNISKTLAEKGQFCRGKKWIGIFVPSDSKDYENHFTIHSFDVMVFLSHFQFYHSFHSRNKTIYDRRREKNDNEEKIKRFITSFSSDIRKQ